MSCAQPQMMVNQTPKYDNDLKRKRKSNGNQVKGKLLIHPDKRRKIRYL